MRAPIYPGEPPTTSWWQQRWPSRGHAPIDRNATAQVVVIGGGVTGCAAARHLARAGARVILLEARDIASGASGRNGGFLLAGLAHRPVALTARVGQARAEELMRITIEGRERLLEVAGAIGAGAFATRTGSLRLAVDDDELDELDAEATLLEQMGDVRVQRLAASELPAPLAGRFLGGLRFPDDGRSVPAAWVRALSDAAVGQGATIHERSPVASIHDDREGVELRTASGHVVRADHVVVATEAWLSGLLPELEDLVMPYRSQVLAAEAPRDDHGEIVRILPHVTWSRRGWDYAQQAADGTLVVGGEQDEDVELLRHWHEATVDRDQRWLERWISSTLDVTPTVVARWAGVLGQTIDGFPFVGPLPGRPRVIACGGWGGAGNVLGFVSGELVARLVHAGDDRVPIELRADRIARH